MRTLWTTSINLQTLNYSASKIPLAMPLLDDIDLSYNVITNKTLIVLIKINKKQRFDYIGK